MEFLLITPMAAALWFGVIKWVRYLDTRDFLESTRPTAAAAALIEAEHPTVMVPR